MTAGLGSTWWQDTLQGSSFLARGLSLYGRGTFVPALVRFGPGFSAGRRVTLARQERAGEQDARADQPADGADSR